MSKHSSLFSPIRRSLLDRSGRTDPIDPFQPLGNPGRPLRLSAPVGPAGLSGARNRPNDVRRLSMSLADAGLPGAERPPRPTDVFDSPLETAVRSFQRRNRLKVDGLLLPKGPTNQALNRSLALMRSKRTPAPPLSGLSGEAFAANGRLVRAMMKSTEDGLVPSLMASDFRANKAGQAKTADFLSQLFDRDPARARTVRAKAGGFMTRDEKNLLDRLTLQARTFDAEALAAQEPGDPDDDEPDEPPYNPDHPRPGDPDDPEPEDPDKPDEPDDPDKPEKPDKEKCKRLRVKLANAEQAQKEAQERAREADVEFDKWSEEANRLRDQLRDGLIQLGIEYTPSFLRIIGILKRLSRKRPADTQTIFSLIETAQEMFAAEEKVERALQAREIEEKKVKALQKDIEKIQSQIDEAGCK